MINVQYYEKKFQELFDDRHATISVEKSDWENKIKVVVKSSYGALPSQTLGFLMKVGKIFGTLDFDNKADKTETKWAYSEYTGGTDTTHIHEYSCEFDKIDSGFPWDAKIGSSL